MVMITKKDDDGTISVYEGVLHNPHGPAIKKPNGDERWYLNGKYHRDGGPAITLHLKNGVQTYWIKHGLYHREGGPAITFHNGDTAWYYEGKRHRQDGPAVVSKTRGNEYYRHGVKVDES
jgi:hypothetical protein